MCGSSAANVRRETAGSVRRLPLPADPTIHSRTASTASGPRRRTTAAGPSAARSYSTLAGPTRKDHAERLAWLSDGFDPETFDLAAPNGAFARIR